MIKKNLNGVTTVEFESFLNLTLCSDCIRPLLDQLCGLKSLQVSVLTPVNNENYYRICDVCSQVINKDRRSGKDRREYEYAIYIPERRENVRRKADDRFYI